MHLKPFRESTYGWLWKRILALSTTLWSSCLLRRLIPAKVSILFLFKCKFYFFFSKGNAKSFPYIATFAQKGHQQYHYQSPAYKELLLLLWYKSIMETLSCINLHSTHEKETSDVRFCQFLCWMYSFRDICIWLANVPLRPLKVTSNRWCHFWIGSHHFWSLFGLPPSP